MSDIQFEFVEELPPKASPGHSAVGRAGDPLLDSFAAALLARPQAWAKWPRPLSQGALHSYPSLIRGGGLRSFRGGDFEVVRRNSDLYVRYVGGAQ
ncbi:hypothetical protein [Nocardia fusca]|uniref:Uncharacterized protein n=1 Tax=Nocardia fusca TaxID=941183 RepID=A0ABV3FIU4_9NOCA